jgi:phosphatidylinositol glycan class W
MSKAEKEAAVYGFHGTTLLETTAIIASMPLLLAASPSRNLLDDIFNVAFPLLIAETIAAEYLPFGTFTIPLVCLFALWWRRVPASTLSKAASREPTKDNYMFAILRGTTVLSTIIAILAVDFPSVFPRRYVKAEWYGAGLMDIGVGAYVFTGAIVRGSKLRQVTIREVITTLFVACMGFIRLIANKSVDYQEHVGEYGVHWNFFVTLTCVKLFSDLFSRFIARGSSLLDVIAGITVLAIHQYALSATVVGLWVMEDADSLARKQYSWAWQNKEGLISLTGYVALDLCTRGSAQWLLERSTYELLALDGVLWAALVIVRSGIEDIARRSANAPYVIWMFAIGVLLIMMSSGLIMPDYREHGKRSKLIVLFSRHQLLIFLVSNLMTGAINLSMNTLVVPVWQAEAILCIYVASVCGIAYGIDYGFEFYNQRQARQRSMKPKQA